MVVTLFLSQEPCCQNIFILNVVPFAGLNCSSNCTDANPYNCFDSDPFLTHALLGAWKRGAFLGALLCTKGWETVHTSVGRWRENS